jgi:fumarate reductase flavoprotein subunit
VSEVPHCSLPGNRRKRRNKIEHINTMEHIKADVVVLGTGGAGMASAITAAEGGAKVVLLEKRPFPGGASNTPVGFGFVKMDRESQDKAFKIHMEGTLWTANADLVRAFCDASGEIPAWLTAMGVQADFPNQGIPMAAEPAPGNGRSQAVVDIEGYCSLKAIGRGHGGAQLIKAMVARARELGVDILFSTPGKKILRAGDRTSGVYAETKTGSTVHIDARAMIIATAGFNEDPEMIKKYSGYDFTLDWYGNCEEGDYFNLCPNLRLTGDGIKMAWEAGADKGRIGIPVWPHVPGPGVIGNMPWIMLSQVRIIQEQPYLWVNQDGKRFMNEEVIPGRLTAGNLIARQRGKCATLIFDDVTRRHMEEESIDKIYFIFPAKKLTDIEGDMRRLIAQGNKHVFVAETLKELAGQAGIDPVSLQETITEYNRYCEKGYDDQYAKDPKYLRPVKKPRFYGLRVFNTAYGTSGGIKVNGKTEVLTKEGKAIPGLYAAGDIILGEYSGDMVNQGIQSFGFALTTGRIAGKSALEYLKKP